MTISCQINGLEAMKANLRNLSGDYHYRLKLALDSVLIEIVNWIKDNHQMLGGWNDQTANLNNSIGWCGDDKGVPTFAASKEARFFPVRIDNGSQWEGDTLKGIVFAGMEYALYVEIKEGHWVLSGGLAEFWPKIAQMIAERIKT